MRREPQRGLVVGSRAIELTAPHIGIAEFRMQLGHHRDSGVIARLRRSGFEPGCEGRRSPRRSCHGRNVAARPGAVGPRCRRAGRLEMNVVAVTKGPLGGERLTLATSGKQRASNACDRQRSSALKFRNYPLMHADCAPWCNRRTANHGPSPHERRTPRCSPARRLRLGAAAGAGGQAASSTTCSRASGAERDTIHLEVERAVLLGHSTGASMRKRPLSHLLRGRRPISARSTNSGRCWRRWARSTPPAGSMRRRSCTIPKIRWRMSTSPIFCCAPAVIRKRAHITRRRCGSIRITQRRIRDWAPCSPISATAPVRGSISASAFAVVPSRRCHIAATSRRCGCCNWSRRRRQHSDQSVPRRTRFLTSVVVADHLDRDTAAAAPPDLQRHRRRRPLRAGAAGRHPPHCAGQCAHDQRSARGDANRADRQRAQAWRG